MPQPFNPAVITDNGIYLLTRAQAGEIKIEFTRIETGNGIYEEQEKCSEVLKTKTGLKSVKNSFCLSGIKIHSENSVKVSALITNYDSVTKEITVTEGYYINEIGLYAREKDGTDSTEVLYSIAVTSGENGDFMPPYNEADPVEIIQDYYATVNSSEEVTVQGDNRVPALAVDLQQTEEKMSAMKEKLDGIDENANNYTHPTTAGNKHIPSGGSAGQVLKYGGSSGMASWGDVEKATKATQDGAGNVIVDTYAKKSIYNDTAISLGRKTGTTVGDNSFAVGRQVTASSSGSHAEGSNTTANSAYSHAEGDTTTASGQSSHAEGSNTLASGGGSHAEGYGSKSTGMYSHAEGGYAVTSGECSHAEGYGTTASNYSSHASGKHNKAMTTGGNYNNQVGDVFVIGNGTKNTALSNALRVTYTGDVMGTKAFQSSGADYAEFIKPWADDNRENEDRIGYFVTVIEGLLYKAEPGDYIVGITSGNPSIVGNADEDYYWRYERDEFNRIVMEDVPEEVQETDENGEPVFDEETHEPIMKETGKIIPNARMKLAENYDSSLQANYIERKDRKEWDYVGILGVLPVRDDGTCIPGRFCRCGQGGIATLAEERDFDTYMVMERIADNVVSVILK